MEIVVTGSLGNISKPLAQKLIKNKHSVTIISSSADRKNEIEAIGAKAAIGSLQDAAFLTSIFNGSDVVYAMIPPNFSSPDILSHYRAIGKSYAEAIEKSGVKKLVQLSSWGAHLPKGTGPIVGSYLVEQILNELQDVNICYLRPASFYYNLNHFIPMIKAAGFIGSNYRDTDKLVMVAPQDIADAALEEIENETTVKKIRYVASDERTCNEIAAVLGAAIGKPDLQWKLFTDEQTQSAMENNHVPQQFAAFWVELNAAIHSGIIREDYDLNKPVMGKVKIEDYAKEFASVFNGH